MNQQTLEKIMQWVLTTGIILSVAFVAWGGILLLIAQGSNPVTQEVFPLTAVPVFSLTTLSHDIKNLTPSGLISLGFLLLALTQVVRVVTIMRYFLSLKDSLFSALSLFILILLTLAIFIPLSIN